MDHEDALFRALPGDLRAMDFSGTWNNGKGSELQLRQSVGKLTGACFSAKGSGSAMGEVQGYVDGDLAAFVVQWRDRRAVSSWVGQLEPGVEPQRIRAYWQMATQLPAGADPVTAGSDSFTKTGDSTPGLRRREPV